jgi:hypothetical protein
VKRSVANLAIILQSRNVRKQFRARSRLGRSAMLIVIRARLSSKPVYAPRGDDKGEFVRVIRPLAPLAMAGKQREVPRGTPATTLPLPVR